MTRKIFYKLHMMRQFRDSLSQSLNQRLFQSLIFPHFIYCSPVFSGSLFSANSKAIDRSLRVCVRFLFDKKRRDNVTSLVPELIALPLQELFKGRRLLSFFKILRSPNTPVYMKKLVTHGTSIRTSQINIPRVSSSWCHNCPLRVASSDWNSLTPQAKRFASITQFSKFIRTYFRQLL